MSGQPTDVLQDEDAGRRLARGVEVELTIEKFADRGKSLARVDGFVVFVAGAVPGDRVRVRVIKRKRKYAEARITHILEPSPLRTQPRCKYSGVCGGCTWQHVDYAAQLDAKRQSVKEALIHHGGCHNIEVQPVIGADSIYAYRNKMEFSFSAHRWLTPQEIATGEPLRTNFALGLHVPGNFAKVVDLTECHLPPPKAVRLVNGLRRFVQERDWKPWNIRRHEGYLRHLVLRTAHELPEYMVDLVTFGHDPERMDMLATWLRSEHAEVTTFVNTVHTGLAQTVYGEATHTVFGSGVIHDKIGPHRFAIAPKAFFQTNTRQAERLYAVILAMADLKPQDLVFDLYCGAGTISVYVASHARRVVGVELVPEAVDNARANAAANGYSNCTFVAGDMLRVFTPDFIAEHGKPNVVIADPPRAGMHARIIGQLMRLRPERLVYVSCNPVSQARDVAMLTDAYHIDRIQPVDLFPHTYHVENVISLRAKRD